MLCRDAKRLGAIPDDRQISRPGEMGDHLAVSVIAAGSLLPPRRHCAGGFTGDRFTTYLDRHGRAVLQSRAVAAHRLPASELLTGPRRGGDEDKGPGLAGSFRLVM
jgi:hypothetical protein